MNTANRMGNNEYLDLDSINNKNLKKEHVETRKNFFYSGLVVGLVLALLIVSTVYLATRVQAYVSMRQNKASQQQNNDSVLDASVREKMQSIEALIDQYYYQDAIDTDALEDGVYRGMIEALGDPYSAYYTQEELAELMNQTEGIYYGIGAAISQDIETTLPKISAVFPQTPAEEAGLREDDIIYEVNGESTYGLSVTEVVSQIKGDEGTTVNLTIVREGTNDFLYVDVQRRRVENPTVDFKMLDDETAYIQIREFDTVTTDQFADALAMAKGNHMTGLIIDLRSNPGGNLAAVVDISRMILPKGLIVYTEDKYGERKEYTCDGTRQLDTPLVVLINGNSASAAEILAGAIKDYDMGSLVGTTTFGKGIVQQVVGLGDGSAVKVTTSSYFTPKGHNIHGIGVEPDVVCEFDAEAYYGEDNFDNQLEEARKVLAGKIIGKSN